MSLTLSGLDKYQPSRILVENNTGSTIAALKAVKLNGAGSSYPQIALATPSTAPVFGIVSSEILTGTVGIVNSLGPVYDVDTTAWAPNTVPYSDGSGNLTSTSTPEPAVAVVLSQGVLGTLFVLALSTQWDGPSGALNYKGTLDASLGVYPPSPIKGDFYIISVAGTIGGHAYAVGDWAVFNGTSWDYVDNTVYVSSVNGQIGNVVLEADDIPYTPATPTNWPTPPDDVAEALDSISNQTFNGDVNSFAGYDVDGFLTSFGSFKRDPDTFNGARWFHDVVPEITDNFRTLHNMFNHYNPAANSRQGWNTYFIESGLGTDDSGFQIGDPVDIKSTYVLQDVTYTANRRGTDGDVVTIEYIGGGTAGSEVVTNPTTFAYVVQIEDGVSTATQIVAAILAQVPSLGNNLTAAVTGVGSNPQTIAGPFNLAGGVNDSGGITMMGLSLYSRNKSNAGFMNGYQSYLDFGNGIDAIEGKNWTAFGGQATIHDNSKLYYLSAMEYGFNVSDTNGRVENDFRGVNLYGNIGDVGQGVNGFAFGVNAKNIRYGNIFANFLRVTGDVENSVNAFADFSNYLGDIGDNYYGVAIQPNINTADGFYGINISPNVALSRFQSIGVNVNMGNVTPYAGVKASVVIQDLTYEAGSPGSGLNGVTVEYVSDTVAGSETATLLGNAITVHMESGVSTATQIRAAVIANLTIASNINVTITGVGSNPQTTQGPTPLSGGIDPGSKSAAQFNNGDVNINNGRFNSQYNFDTATTPVPFVYGFNNIGGALKVSSGFPINGGQFGIANNLGIGLQIEDDILPDSSGLNLGFNMVAALTQAGVAAGKTMDALSFFSGGASIPTGSGSLTNVAVFRALGLLPQGGTLNVTNMYGMKVEAIIDAVGAANTWGVFVDSAGDNYFAGSLNIGNATKKVSNSDIALEIGSKKAFRVGVLTTAERDALVPLEGMMIFNTDTKVFEGYDGTVWVGL